MALADTWKTSVMSVLCLKVNSGTMAYTAQKSPLLSLRPEFLAVGRSLGRMNIFTELSHISGLYNYSIQPSNFFSEQFSTCDDLDEPVTPSSGRSDQTNDSFDNKTAPLSEVEDEQMFKRNTPTLKLEDQDKTTVESDEQMSKRNTPTVMQEGHDKATVESADNSNTAKDKLFNFSPKTLTLFKLLTSLKIHFETEIYHPKEERLHVDPNIFYCKNLFLKDRKGQYYLVICHEDLDMNLKQLRRDLNAYRNFNFGTAQDMDAILGTEPGGVTPLALMNESAKDVTMVISKSLVKDGAMLMFHPLDSSLATKISLADLLRFLRHVDHPVTFVK